jgi:hypothetical protein
MEEWDKFGTWGKLQPEDFVANAAHLGEPNLQESTIKVDIQEVERECVGWIGLAQSRN